LARHPSRYRFLRISTVAVRPKFPSSIFSGRILDEEIARMQHESRVRFSNRTALEHLQALGVFSGSLIWSAFLMMSSCTSNSGKSMLPAGRLTMMPHRAPRMNARRDRSLSVRTADLPSTRHGRSATDRPDNREAGRNGRPMPAAFVTKKSSVFCLHGPSAKKLSRLIHILILGGNSVNQASPPRLSYITSNSMVCYPGWPIKTSHDGHSSHAYRARLLPQTLFATTLFSLVPRRSRSAPRTPSPWQQDGHSAVRLLAGRLAAAVPS